MTRIVHRQETFLMRYTRTVHSTTQIRKTKICVKMAVLSTHPWIKHGVSRLADKTPASLL